MDKTQMKTFLRMLINVYPYYKTRIIDKNSFIDNWIKAFGDRTKEDMWAAAQIHVDRCRFFPTISEFEMSLILVDSRKTVAAQEECERTHPTSEEDRKKLDAAIYELFEKEDD